MRSKLNLKSLYLGTYRNPELNASMHNMSLNYNKIPESDVKNESLILKSNTSSKFNTLYDEPMVSGCCSPTDSMQANESCNRFRFLPKDSQESFDMLNHNISSKVELKPRNDPGK